MSQSKVIVFGTGKLAEYICYVLRHDTSYEVAALTIQRQYRPDRQTLWNLDILDFETLEKHYPPSACKLFIAVGNNTNRARIYQEASERGYQFASYISSKAIVWEDLKYGDNVIVSEGTVIGPFVEIGEGSFLLGPRVAHHCKIGQHTLLSGCYLGGDSKVGDNSFLGMNSTVNQNVTVGRANIIGVGSNICAHTNDHEVFTNSRTVKRTVTAELIKNKYLS
ncbi:MAG: acetyltransferase [Arcticibacter sp.]